MEVNLEHLLLIWSHGGKPGAYAFTGDIEAHFVAIHALIRAVEVYPWALDALIGVVEAFLAAPEAHSWDMKAHCEAMIYSVVVVFTNPTCWDGVKCSEEAEIILYSSCDGVDFWLQKMCWKF